MHSYRIADAARLLGVSDDTVRRWVDAGTLPTIGSTPVEIPGDALARRAVELAAGRMIRPTCSRVRATASSAS